MTYRKTLLTVLIAGLICTGFSFFAQYVMQMNPCPLCILQRVAVISVTLTAAITLIFPTRQKSSRVAAASLVSIPALWGLGIALYQLWIQSLPAAERPSCGAPWTFRLRDWPLFEIWEPVVRGFGDCGTREYLAGIPLPVWSLLFFSFVLIWVWAMLKRAK